MVVALDDLGSAYELTMQSLHCEPLAASLHEYNYDISPYLPSLPVVHAEEHPSLSTIRGDTSLGGTMVNNLLDSAIKYNTTGLEIFLTPTGVSETQKLISLFNGLPEGSPVGSYITGLQEPYNFHTNGLVSQDTSWVSHTHKLPVSSREISYCGEQSGVYMFNHVDTGYKSIGSALTMKSRNMEHYVAFTRKPKLYMHN